MIIWQNIIFFERKKFFILFMEYRNSRQDIWFTGVSNYSYNWKCYKCCYLSNFWVWIHFAARVQNTDKLWKINLKFIINDDLFIIHPSAISPCPPSTSFNEDKQIDYILINNPKTWLFLLNCQNCFCSTFIWFQRMKIIHNLNKCMLILLLTLWNV